MRTHSTQMNIFTFPLLSPIYIHFFRYLLQCNCWRLQQLRLHPIIITLKSKKWDPNFSKSCVRPQKSKHNKKPTSSQYVKFTHSHCLLPLLLYDVFKMCSNPAAEIPVGVIYMKFWVQFECSIADGHRKTPSSEESESIISCNTPLSPCLSPACARTPYSLSMCLLQELGRLWCQRQHRWFPSTLWMNSRFPCSWGSPQPSCFQPQPHICCCLLSTDKFGCAEPGKELCFQLRRLQLLPTSQISCCSTISTCLLLSFRRKHCSFVSYRKKHLKSRVKRWGREVRREDKGEKKESTKPLFLLCAKHLG